MPEPIDASTLYGYLVLLNFELFAAILFFIFISTIVTLFLGCGLYFNVFRAHFEVMMRDMDDSITDKIDQRAKLRLKTSLIDAVKFHTEVRVWVT